MTDEYGKLRGHILELENELDMLRYRGRLVAVVFFVSLGLIAFLAYEQIGEPGRVKRDIQHELDHRAATRDKQACAQLARQPKSFAPQSTRIADHCPTAYRHKTPKPTKTAPATSPGGGTTTIVVPKVIPGPTVTSSHVTHITTPGKTVIVTPAPTTIVPTPKATCIPLVELCISKGK